VNLYFFFFRHCWQFLKWSWYDCSYSNSIRKLVFENERKTIESKNPFSRILWNVWANKGEMTILSEEKTSIGPSCCYLIPVGVSHSLLSKRNFTFWKRKTKTVSTNLMKTFEKAKEFWNQEGKLFSLFWWQVLLSSNQKYGKNVVHNEIHFRQ